MGVTSEISSKGISFKCIRYFKTAWISLAHFACSNNRSARLQLMTSDLCSSLPTLSGLLSAFINPYIPQLRLRLYHGRMVTTRMLDAISGSTDEKHITQVFDGFVSLDLPLFFVRSSQLPWCSSSVFLSSPW
jgi:hypothetical protein